MRKLYIEKYMEDYEFEELPCKNKRGSRKKLVYKGKWYYWQATRESVRKLKIMDVAHYVFGMGAYFLAAEQNVWVNKTALVAIPAMISLAAAVLLCVYIARFIITGKKMTRLQSEEIRQGILVCTAVQTALLAFTTVIGIIGIFFHDVQLLPVLTVAGYALNGYMSWSVFLRHKVLQVSTYET